MATNKNLLNFGKFAAITLLIIFIGYLSFDKIKVLSPMDSLIASTTSTSIPSNNVLADSIVNYGMKFLGTPYVAGGSGKDGFDCSGFIYFVYTHFKIDVPRSSADFEHFGEEIPIENVQKGDLLLFLSPTRNVIGHIGIVSKANGSESDFIHSTSGRDMKVVITSLANKGYTARFVKAIRVL